VSFETIEHLSEHEAFLSEIARVLKPSGLFVVSSPNRTVYTEKNNHHNPFHVRELDRDQFLTVLRRQFSEVSLLAQRPVCGSALVPERGPSGMAGFETQDGLTFLSSHGLPSPHYFIALASNRPLPEATSSLLCNDTYVPQLQAAVHWEAKRVADAQATAQASTALLDATKARIADLERSVAQRDAQLLAYAERIAEVEQSPAWSETGRIKDLHQGFPGIRNSPLAIRIAAAWRYPTRSERRKGYRQSKLAGAAVPVGLKLPRLTDRCSGSQAATTAACSAICSQRHSGPRPASSSRVDRGCSADRAPRDSSHTSPAGLSHPGE